MELLDDIEDHWDSSTHIKERDACIVRFQVGTHCLSCIPCASCWRCTCGCVWQAQNHAWSEGIRITETCEY